MLLCLRTKCSANIFTLSIISHTLQNSVICNISTNLNVKYKNISILFGLCHTLIKYIIFPKCTNYFDTIYSVFFVLSGKIFLNLCSILFVSSTFNCSFAILWRISKRCFFDTPCFIISELADSILDNTTNWLMLAVSLIFIPLDAKFGFAWTHYFALHPKRIIFNISASVA